MKALLLTIDQLAAILQISVKSIRRAYRKGEIPVERICRFVRFDLERVKEAMQGFHHISSQVVPLRTVPTIPRHAWVVKEPVRGHWGTAGDRKGQYFYMSTVLMMTRSRAERRYAKMRAELFVK